MKLSTVRLVVGATGILVVGSAAASVWLWRSRPVAAKGLVYLPAGFGGYRAQGRKALTRDALYNASVSRPSPKIGRGSYMSADWMEGRVLEAAADYQAGKYADAETVANQVDRRVGAETRPATEERRAEARVDLITGYCEARQKNMQSARERFGKVREECSKLPDHGARSPHLGEPPPTMEEEAAYEHAVCTAALGEKAEAKGEYMALMREFPESPLVHGAIKRISWLNGGEIPKDAEETWKAAMRAAKARADARERERSLCGPACLAAALGVRPPDFGRAVHALADEMGTSAQGTSLEALAGAARKRGFAAEGLQLTMNGLEKGMPSARAAIALTAPNHFVIVRAVSADGVKVWDPDRNGAGKGGELTYSAAEWGRKWDGVVLALRWGTLTPKPSP